MKIHLCATFVLSLLIPIWLVNFANEMRKDPQDDILIGTFISPILFAMTVSFGWFRISKSKLTTRLLVLIYYIGVLALCFVFAFMGLFINEQLGISD